MADEITVYNFVCNLELHAKSQVTFWEKFHCKFPYFVIPSESGQQTHHKKKEAKGIKIARKIWKERSTLVNYIEFAGKYAQC